VILEAFAKYLRACDPDMSAPAALACWLWERLTNPPRDTVDKVLHTEIAIREALTGRKQGETVEAPAKGYVFAGASTSGRRLLKSLHEYASSYEQQKWSRWVHCIKASDFNNGYNEEK
jgi:hypothetical protein